MTTDELPGLTIVYTGTGKGKTTAAFGLALRMLGHGWKVLVLQFMKGPLPTGERLAALRLEPDLTIRTLGEGYVCLQGGAPTDSDRLTAHRAWLAASQAVAAADFQAVILDELNVCTSLGLIPVSDVLHLIETRPRSVTLVITGRDADPSVCNAADIVTEMSSLRHTYDSGRPDIEGIDH